MPPPVRITVPTPPVVVTGPPLPPPRNKSPRVEAELRARLVVRLHRDVVPNNTSLASIKQLILDTASAAPMREISPHAPPLKAFWAFDIEPLFPGGNFQPPFRMGAYFLVNLPWLRGNNVGSLWDLAAHLVLNISTVELAFPEQFYKAYAPLSGGTEKSGPDDMAWSLRQMSVPQARAFAQQQGRPGQGEGIVVGHLDTGWSNHQQLQPWSTVLDLGRQKNLLSLAARPARVEDPKDAHDPYVGPLDIFHSHGLATASVLAARGTISSPGPGGGSPHAAGTRWGTGGQAWPAMDPAKPDTTLPESASVAGVAPAVKVLPVRCVDSVILTGDVEVAQAIWYAAEQSVDVITMSLGGVPSPLLHAALGYAVYQRNVIFCAAAGNLVPFVVFPAAYPDAIACAGTTPSGAPWSPPGSSFGPQVDISAPAQSVWVAHMEGNLRGIEKAIVNVGEGTSFATPAVAGAAAVWLAFHGKSALLARYGTVPLQDVFRMLLKSTARNTLPQGQAWPSDFGAGVLDLNALLRAPLPAPGQVVRQEPWSPDAYLGYLSEGIEKAVAASGATALPPPLLMPLHLLELAQLAFAATPLGQALTDLAQGATQALANAVDELAAYIQQAARAVSEFLRGLFS